MHITCNLRDSDEPFLSLSFLLLQEKWLSTFYIYLLKHPFLSQRKMWNTKGPTCKGISSFLLSLFLWIWTIFHMLPLWWCQDWSWYVFHLWWRFVFNNSLHLINRFCVTTNNLQIYLWENNNACNIHAVYSSKVDITSIDDLDTNSQEINHIKSYLPWTHEDDLG